MVVRVYLKGNTFLQVFPNKVNSIYENKVLDLMTAVPHPCGVEYLGRENVSLGG